MTTKIAIPILLCCIGVMLICFNVCDICAYLDANGMVHDNIFCCLGPPFIVFLGIVWLVVALILKITSRIKQLRKSRKI